MATILVTVSDDRFGRKNGLYRLTQSMICATPWGNSRNSYWFKIIRAWTWEDILKTEFYQQNKTLLDNKDAARNGRAYKPYVILEALKEAEDGDFVIYNDCSPELWKNIDSISNYDIDVIKELCVKANDILVPFIKWSRIELKLGELGEATHKNYTLNRCMDKMGMRFYEDAYMCASGMICIRKTPATETIIKEWLQWNLIDECCALGWAHIENDCSFWNEESHEQFGKPGYKMGCRHDQSILGLLLSSLNWKFVDVEISHLHPANFLQFCRPNTEYRFIDSLPMIGTGDKVINKQGTELTVFGLYGMGYQVGQNSASMYLAHRENLKRI